MMKYMYKCIYVTSISLLIYITYNVISVYSDSHHNTNLPGQMIQNRDFLRDVTTNIEKTSAEDKNTSTLSTSTLNTSDMSSKLEVKGKTKVVLFTLYRGGSTFLGEIFGQNPHAFYWFEPLNGFMKYYDSVENATGYSVVERFYMKTATGLVPLPPEALHNRTDVVLETLNCSPRKQVVHKGSSTALAIHMPAAKSYANCMKESKHSVKHCSPLLTKACQNAEIVASKTMRLPIYLVEDLLQVDPSTKVIYYVRDPRGVMNSRRKLNHEKYMTKVLNAAANLCLKLVKSDEYLAVLMKKYPQNMIMVRYEDLATKPVEVTKRIYDFLEQPVPDAVTRWIEENTKAVQKNGVYGTTRNSSEAMDSWKRELPSSAISEMTKVCATAIQLLGYDMNPDTN